MCAFIDAEHAIDAHYARKLGVDIDALYVSQPDSGEQALEIADTLIRSGAVDVVVLDSVAALVPRAELEGEMGDQQIALQARLMSQALRKLTGSLSKSNCLLIFLNQIRQKVGIIFGSPEVTSGGTALRYYASVRLDIRRKTAIKEGENIVGNETVVKVAKNKLASPFKTASFDMMFGKGIDRYSELVLMADSVCSCCVMTLTFLLFHAAGPGRAERIAEAIGCLVLPRKQRRLECAAGGVIAL